MYSRRRAMGDEREVMTLKEENEHLKAEVERLRAELNKLRRPDKAFISMAGARELLSTSNGVIKRLITSGDLKPAAIIGDRLMFKREDLEAVRTKLPRKNRPKVEKDWDLGPYSQAELAAIYQEMRQVRTLPETPNVGLLSAVIARLSKNPSRLRALWILRKTIAGLDKHEIALMLQIVPSNVYQTRRDILFKLGSQLERWESQKMNGFAVIPASIT